MWRRSDECAPSAARASDVVVLTNMQWFYGPTWGSTLRLCEQLAAPRQLHGHEAASFQRTHGCAWSTEVHARQLELIEVLRRNAAHPAVAEVHVLVGEAEPVRQFLRRLPWHTEHGCKVHLVATGRRPSFRDYLAHVATHLLGRVVAITNQDVMLDSGPWETLAAVLPPRTALFLSRYHERVVYDVASGVAAGTAEGIFNGSSALLRSRGRGGLGGQLSLFPSRAPSSRRVCDMSAPRFSLWRRSLCTPDNFGSYDAYVVRLMRAPSSGVLDLFAYPQNAWGGENLFLFLVQHALRMSTANPCLDLRTVHVHCELATAFGVQKVGDRRQGKREISDRARAKLRALGMHRAAASPADVGGLRLNVTTLSALERAPWLRRPLV